MPSHNSNSEMSGMDDITFFQAIIELLARKPDAEPRKDPFMDTVAKELAKARTQPKEMPEVLQALVQEFARPVSRGDWRTAKLEEAMVIRQLHYDKHLEAVEFIGGIEFWDIILGQTFYELLKNYPAGDNTIQLRRHWG